MLWSGYSEKMSILLLAMLISYLGNIKNLLKILHSLFIYLFIYLLLDYLDVSDQFRKFPIRFTPDYFPNNDLKENY